MSGSCHLDGRSNVKIGFECQIFVIVIFLNQVLQFRAHSRYYKGALTQKRSFFYFNVLLSDLIFVAAEKIKTNTQH